MRKIMLLGAGKSANILIDYILDHAVAENWELYITDLDKDTVLSKIKDRPHGHYFEFDLNSDQSRKQSIEHADLVISMLPAMFHPIIANDCIRLKKHLITPSYISNEMKELDKDAKALGLVFLNEIGVDPGIDHMSAMKVLDEIRSKGGKITAFESFTGGLVAPQSDDNPWHYKFTWNPRNVVLAGQGLGGIKFLHNGRYKYIPYHKMFQRTEMIEIGEHGKFEGYANRDSLKYQEAYDLHDVQTMYRGTFRRPGFCDGWDALIQLGMTDDSYVMAHTENMTYRDFTNSFLKYRKHDSVEIKTAYYLGLDIDGDIMKRLKWLGLFDETKVVGLTNVTPAQALQKILEEKWELKPNDDDMIVMWHKFNYELNGELKEINSSMVVMGTDSHNTAMAQTVGLPMGIAAKMILNGTLSTHGVVMPTLPEIYEPILKELETLGVVFTEEEVEAKPS